MTKLSRRSFLANGAALSMASGFYRLAYGRAAEEPYSDIAVTDAWITEWMQGFDAVEGTLYLGRFADPMYYLRETIGWGPGDGQTGERVDVPVGFVTDFASIPRVFWTILPKDGLYTYPAIIHDYLYWEQPVARKEADQVMRYVMEDFNVSSVTISTIYSAVRLGGSGAWSDNVKRKAAGQKRILNKFPDDPTVTWTEWQKRDDIY